MSRATTPERRAAVPPFFVRLKGGSGHPPPDLDLAKQRRIELRARHRLSNKTGAGQLRTVHTMHGAILGGTSEMVSSEHWIVIPEFYRRDRPAQGADGR